MEAKANTLSYNTGSTGASNQLWTSDGNYLKNKASTVFYLGVSGGNPAITTTSLKWNMILGKATV